MKDYKFDMSKYSFEITRVTTNADGVNVFFKSFKPLFISNLDFIDLCDFNGTYMCPIRSAAEYGQFHINFQGRTAKALLKLQCSNFIQWAEAQLGESILINK